MRKQISQIRDLQLIEKELDANPAGVLAIYLENDKVVQLTTTFLYMDKNIYFFFNEKDELFNSIKLENDVSFTILRNEKARKGKDGFLPNYQVLSISVSGSLKVVDDKKLIDDLCRRYVKKYSAEGDEESENKFIRHNWILFIDTNEIQAFEESGG
jgi:nitroimidazol reductase NimA-like FMN-containing flavoprotein (pyridoxamine 5'-phosphate oxidase superfamily)